MWPSNHDWSATAGMWEQTISAQIDTDFVTEEGPAVLLHWIIDSESHSLMKTCLSVMITVMICEYFAVKQSDQYL